MTDRPAIPADPIPFVTLPKPEPAVTALGFARAARRGGKRSTLVACTQAAMAEGHHVHVLDGNLVLCYRPDGGLCRLPAGSVATVHPLTDPEAQC